MKTFKQFIENDDKVLHLSLMTKALKTMPGSPKQKEIIKQLNKVRKRLKLEPLKEAPRIPRKKGQPAGSDKHSIYIQMRILKVQYTD